MATRGRKAGKKRAIAPKRARSIRTPAVPRARALTPDDVREIDETVAPIPDPDVRAAARRLLGTARRFATPRGAVS